MNNANKKVSNLVNLPPNLPLAHAVAGGNVDRSENRGATLGGQPLNHEGAAEYNAGVENTICSVSSTDAYNRATNNGVTNNGITDIAAIHDQGMEAVRQSRLQNGTKMDVIE